MTDEPTYTGRTLETWRVAKIDNGCVTSERGWGSAGLAPELVDRLKVGDEFEMETIRGTMTVGARFQGRWYGRLSDQDVLRRDAEFRADMDRRSRETLEEKRMDWERRTVALPEWIRARIAHFIQQGGENFAVNGWGYELIIAELAAMYAESDCQDTPEIEVYANIEGTSGNQHDMAKALARAHLEDPERSMAGTVAGLSPITGDPDYSKRT